MTQTFQNPTRVLVAMSGGVDSSVAALLLQRAGCECLGVTMKLFQNDTVGAPEGHSCCALDDVEDARRVAYRLGMKHYVFSFSEQFRTEVIDRFARAYAAGYTPNPCIDCNRYLKFGALYRRARELGCDAVATGHYARVEYDPARGRWLLKTAADARKDQSYVLYSLTQEQLAHTRFPLGTLPDKATARALAAQAGLCNAQKHDSQDICFVPDGDYAAFLERYTGRAIEPGALLDTDGNVIGTHAGAVRYTLGQRRGLGHASCGRLYVCGKDMAANTVTLGPEAALYTGAATVGNLNWIAFDAPAAPFRARVKTRYRHAAQPATVTPLPEGRVRVDFDEAQRAVTPGQAAVFYDGEIVLGGGTIEA